MGFKKHNWLTYGRRGDIVEITIRDETGRKLDFFRTADKESFKKIAKIIKLRYGFDFSPEIKPEESVNAKEALKKEKSWLDKDLEW